MNVAIVARGLVAASRWRQPMRYPEIAALAGGLPVWLSCYLGFGPFRYVLYEESVRVEGEHHVQNAIGVLFFCHLQRPQYALGPHVQRRGGGRAAIHFDTNSDHSGPPSVCKVLPTPFTPLPL